jgi:hypothetical protein
MAPLLFCISVLLLHRGDIASLTGCCAYRQQQDCVVASDLLAWNDDHRVAGFAGVALGAVITGCAGGAGIALGAVVTGCASRAG